MPRTKLPNSYKPNVIGMARLFARGGDYHRLTPRDADGFLGITEVGGLTIALADDVTYEIQSGDDGNTTIERIAARGRPEAQTGNLTQVLDEALDEPWWRALRRDAPMRFLIPMGTNRAIQDITSFKTMLLVDGVQIRTNTIDDNINQRDAGTVPTPLTMSCDFGYHPLNVHLIYGLSFELQEAGTLAHEVIATDFRQTTEEGINYFMATAGAADAASSIVGRNGFDEWQTVHTLATDDGAASDPAGARVDDMQLIAGKLLLVCSNIDGHIIVDTDELLDGSPTEIVVKRGYTDTKEAKAVHARSAGEIILVGDGGYVYFADSLLGGVTAVNAGVATTANLNDVHAFEDQVMAVGETGVVIVSEDFGRTWSAANVTGATETNNCVFLTNKDVAFVGTASGKLFQTLDFGQTWVELSHGVGGLAVINDIQFLQGQDVVSDIGYLVGNDTTATALKGLVARTVDGGRTWHDSGNHIIAPPVLQTAAALTVRDANSVLVAGQNAASAGAGFLVDLE